MDAGLRPEDIDETMLLFDKNRHAPRADRGGCASGRAGARCTVRRRVSPPLPVYHHTPFPLHRTASGRATSASISSCRPSSFSTPSRERLREAEKPPGSGRANAVVVPPCPPCHVVATRCNACSACFCRLRKDEEEVIAPRKSVTSRKVSPQIHSKSTGSRNRTPHHHHPRADALLLLTFYLPASSK